MTVRACWGYPEETNVNDVHITLVAHKGYITRADMEDIAEHFLELAPLSCPRGAVIGDIDVDQSHTDWTNL